MAVAIDANVLISAANDDSALQRSSVEALSRELDAGEPVVLFVPSLVAFLRVSTHPRLFRPPLSLEQAFGNLRALMQIPNVSVEGSGPSLIDHLADVAIPADARGKLIHDAEIVALMKEHHVARIVTGDRDFLRFQDIEVTLVER